MRDCGRPECNEPAAATIGFDIERRAVWLHPLDEPEATGRLCSRHADSLRAPQGWRCFDYREPIAAEREVVEPAARRAKEPVQVSPGGPGGDVEELLDAQTPLLERAFRGARAS